MSDTPAAAIEAEIRMDERRRLVAALRVEARRYPAGQQLVELLVCGSLAWLWCWCLPLFCTQPGANVPEYAA
jgi:hypothetical protein